MALPKHLKEIADSPKAQKIYKKAQYESGKKKFGKKAVIEKMRGAYKK